jgi:hypothetical protein
MRRRGRYARTVVAERDHETRKGERMSSADLEAANLLIVTVGVKVWAFRRKGRFGTGVGLPKYLN